MLVSVPLLPESNASAFFACSPRARRCRVATPAHCKKTLATSWFRNLASILRRRKCTPGLREASCRAVTALVTVGASTDVDGDGRGGRLASEDAAERAAAAFTAAGGSAALIDCLQPLGSNEAVPGEASGGGRIL